MKIDHFFLTGNLFNENNMQLYDVKIFCCAEMLFQNISFFGSEDEKAAETLRRSSVTSNWILNSALVPLSSSSLTRLATELATLAGSGMISLTRSDVAPHLDSASPPGMRRSGPASPEQTRRRRSTSPCRIYWDHPEEKIIHIDRNETFQWQFCCFCYEKLP